MLSGGALALLTASAIASAQVTTQTTNFAGSNISLRLGASFALNPNLRDIQDLWFGLGAEYQITSPADPGDQTYVSLDWIGKSGSGTNGNYFPLCINERFPLTRTTTGTQAYAFLGVGIVVIDIGGTGTAGGARGGFGYNFSQNVFAETSLVVSGQVNGYQATSVGVYLGYRF